MATTLKSAHFATHAQVRRYYRGKTIRCLICGERFRRLATHLTCKHALSADEYKGRYGLPWSRGLTSEASRRNSGWTPARRAEARSLAYRGKFYKRAHLVEPRAMAPFARQLSIRNLGRRATGFGPRFDRKVRALFTKGLSDRKIAAILCVSYGAVYQRTRHWRIVAY